jgi:hypothetical protein
LIQQAASKLREVDPLLSVGIALQRRRRRGTPRILVGSVQALSQPKRLARGRLPSERSSWMKRTTPRPQLSAAPCCSGGLRVRRAPGPRSDRYPKAGRTTAISQGSGNRSATGRIWWI